MTAPVISVLIDTYNHECFIEQAIASVLEQDFPASEREIIVVDDGSTDRSPELIRRFGPEVRLIQKQNGGQASAFNAGIPECRGEFVAFLDGDDFWQPGKLAAVVAEFQAHPEIGAVGHGIIEVDAGGQKLITHAPEKLFEVRLHTVQQAREFLPLRMFLGTSRLAVRREILKHVIPLPAGLIVEADEFLVAHVTALAGARVLSQPLTSYRLHAGNLYQFAEWSSARVQRKLDSLACIVNELPGRLASAGVANDVINAVVAPVRLDVDRMRLSLRNGRFGEAAVVEREGFRQAYRHASFGYHVFHTAVLAAATILPSTWFYRLRRWYSARGLARLRRLAGDVTPYSALSVQESHTPESRK